SYCERERVAFTWGAAKRRAGVDLSRRSLVTSVACGALAAPVMRIAPPSYRQNPYLLRPPGAAEEAEFLRRCIRCGECMKVCIGQALHPALLQAGAAALWTPLLVARLGYCEYNCTLCGQVCPTGAIEKLPLEKKRQTVIGLAVFNKDRCLPYARGEECLVCEEHCPTPQKAIVFDHKEVLTPEGIKSLKLPRVIKKRCIGCGICETRCPVVGTSAIRVIHEGETRAGSDPLQAIPAYGAMKRDSACKKA
ncbi:MAG: (4Fe-4S)-binding protein, partial [Desulfuromonas sp.]